MDESVSLAVVGLSGRDELVDVEVGLSVEVPVVEVEGEGDGVGSSLGLLSVGVSGVSTVMEIGGLLSVGSSSSEANKMRWLHHVHKQLRKWANLHRHQHLCHCCIHHHTHSEPDH